MNYTRARRAPGSTRQRQVALLTRALLVFLLNAGWSAQAAESSLDPIPTFKQFCFGCHGKSVAMGGISVEKLTSSTSVGENFQHWEKVAGALERKQMPPAKMKQPSEEQRSQAVAWIRGKLNDYAQKHAGDPGRVTVRRLTSGEYSYTINDLTGLDLSFDRDFVSDSAGGEGFTNFGDVQFVDDANLERYLEAAKRVSEHAVIGAGPLGFFIDPGKSGQELSAIKRIQDIYRANGFRSVAAEGATPYGLDLYRKVFFAAWRLRYRSALGEPATTLAQIARREGLSEQFLRHVWTILQHPSPTYPMSEVVARFRKMPAPSAPKAEELAKAQAIEMQNFVVDWPRWLFAAGELAAGGQGDERALVLSDSSVQATAKNQFRFLIRPARGEKLAKIHISLVSANPDSLAKPVTVWSNAIVKVRKADRSAGPQFPLATVLTAESLKKLNWTRESTEFQTDSSLSLTLALPENAGFAELQMEAKLAPGQPDDTVVRTVLSEDEKVSKGRPSWALLANPDSAGFKTWKSNVLQFAANLPQNSQGEPAPADRDPIPAPFNNTYNQPERDKFHTTLKYYRTDQFLVGKMLDSETRKKLDQAWNDLLSSFDYHDQFLRFVAGKYKFDIGEKGIADLTAAEITAIPAEPRKYVLALQAEHRAVNAAVKAASTGHLEDALRFAAQAWRRPLTEPEKARLRSFYTKTRTEQKLDHAKAVRSLLARVLVAPVFLYRLEQPSQISGMQPLSNWELASRLSYFLWSSAPDQELQRAAKAGELTQTAGLERQVKRMLAGPKARRFSTEFFGQWLGFYRFDQYKGVDTTRFPEFTEEVKASMYDEAVSFFEHVVRKDKPVGDLLFADYAFLNKPLAKHYGLKKEVASAAGTELVQGASELQRGGLLRLGAVLTATSAPLRTSPVKRGDWLLRRVLGTPTPPPPADAGSIPADDKLFGGLSVKERLLAHQKNATCAGCHTRIDPLGFPLEKYDAVGRWREQYSDGKTIEDSTAMADKTEIVGVEGLLTYLRSNEKQVLKNFSSKLLGYALGRTVIGSDQPLIEKMTAAGYQTNFSKLAAAIVTSKQFRYRREDQDLPPQQTQRRPAMRIPEKEGGL